MLETICAASRYNHTTILTCHPLRNSRL